MQLPWLMHQIETHADELSEQVIQAVRTSPRTRSMGELSEAELKSRFFDLFRHFGRWISEKNEDEIEGTYGELGQRRCREGMPLNELIYALILVKQHVWDYVLKNVMPVSEGRLYEEELLGEMLGKFFDRALYHTVRGYEEAWSKEALLRLLAGPLAASRSATTGIARAILGELEARRDVLDNDGRLRAVTFTIKLEPPGTVRSLTFQQESHTEGARR